MEQNKMNKSEAKWKEVMIGGVSGIALGTAGTLLASYIPIDAAAENSDSQDTPNTENDVIIRINSSPASIFVNIHSLLNGMTAQAAKAGISDNIGPI